MNHKFFVKSFIIISLLIFVSIESFIYILKDRLIYTKALVNARNSNIKCLILGDSHPQDAFRNNIESCSNLALGGSSIPMVRDVLSSVLEYNSLKTVIISLDPHNFSKYRQGKYSDMLKNVSKTFDPFYKPLFNFFPVREEISGYLKNKPDRKWSNKSIDKQKIRIQDRVKLHSNLSNFETSDYANIYRDILNKLVKKNIQVYLVSTPVVKEYEQELFKHLDEERWNKFVNSLLSKNIKYINYQSLNFDNTKLDLFTDEDHLNKNGSIIYTNILKKKINLY